MKRILSGTQDDRRVKITNAGDSDAHIADRHLELFDSDEFPDIRYEGAYVLSAGAAPIEWVVAAGDELHVDGEVEIEVIPPDVRDAEHGPAEQDG